MNAPDNKRIAMKKQRYIVEIEMPDGDFISAEWLKDLIQKDCDVEDEGREKITVQVQETSLPSNLDEAAEENSKNYYCSCLENHNETGICDGCENVKLAFKAGAEWMAGQVMMLKWKYPEEKYQYPECLTRIMDEYGDWHYTISEGHLNPDCEYISLAELSLRLATR